MSTTAHVSAISGGGGVVMCDKDSVGLECWLSNLTLTLDLFMSKTKDISDARDDADANGWCADWIAGPFRSHRYSDVKSYPSKVIVGELNAAASSGSSADILPLLLETGLISTLAMSLKSVQPTDTPGKHDTGNMFGALSAGVEAGSISNESFDKFIGALKAASCVAISPLRLDNNKAKNKATDISQLRMLAEWINSTSVFLKPSLAALVDASLCVVHDLVHARGTRSG